MSLRLKIVLMSSVVFLLFGGTMHLVQTLFVLPSFTQAERGEALDDLGRYTQAIRRECAHLSSCAADYAAWDDTYQFVVDQNAHYVTANLIPETYKNLGINLLAIIGSDGHLVWGQVRADDGGAEIKMPGLFAALRDPNHRLVKHEVTDSVVSGVLMTERGPMLVGSRPIVTSQRKGPVRGAVIMGRLLLDSAVSDLNDQTRIRASFSALDAVSPEDQPALAHLTHTATAWISDRQQDYLQAYTIVSDINDRPALLLRADLPRVISGRGRMAADLALITSAAGGAVLAVALWFMLAHVVIDPLTRVTAHAARVGAAGDLRVRLNMTARDEIGTLARAFDQMVDHLAESRAQMLDVARHAGMAEIATDVLHNVGNVLNSVNVSATLVTEKLRKSEIPTLGLAAQMMLDHANDLGHFVTQDKRGQRLPEFLAELSGFLAREQESMLQEMTRLSDAIEHIRRVVDTQQVNARGAALIEMVDPAALADEALRLVADSFARHGIHVERHYQSLGELPLQRHKVLQILINLINNAKHALGAARPDEPKIVVRIATRTTDDGDRLQITVADNGAGIAPEHIERIFAFGFSTRSDGHGFGLHGAANAAGEMGGSLTAASDGPGCGATFTLEIPLVREEVQS